MKEPNYWLLWYSGVVPVIIRSKSFNPNHQLYEYDIVAPKVGVVGRAQLRLVPSKSPTMPKGFENHVYYEVDAEHRGKGYATDALRLVLRDAKKHGVKEVILTCMKGNLASQRVIEKCSGVLIDTSTTSEGLGVLKYSFAPA